MIDSILGVGHRAKLCKRGRNVRYLCNVRINRVSKLRVLNGGLRDNSPRLHQFLLKLETAMENVASNRLVSKEDSVFNVIVDRLIQIYQPERIYLFGSTARGDAGPDSDYDFMILVSDAAPPEVRDPGAGYRALWRMGVAMDLLVWTRSQFESRLHLKASLPSTVLREGKLVYAA